jgi:hypothetical protein
MRAAVPSSLLKETIRFYALLFACTDEQADRFLLGLSISLPDVIMEISQDSIAHSGTLIQTLFVFENLFGCKNLSQLLGSFIVGNTKNLCFFFALA